MVSGDVHERKTIMSKMALKGQAPEAVINSHPGAALAEHGGRMAVDNCSHWEKTNSKPGSILNADGNENLVTVLNSGKMKFATFRKMELQFYGKMICNFWEKCLAKNTPVVSPSGLASLSTSLQNSTRRISVNPFAQFRKA